MDLRRQRKGVWGCLAILLIACADKDLTSPPALAQDSKTPARVSLPQDSGGVDVLPVSVFHTYRRALSLQSPQNLPRLYVHFGFNHTAAIVAGDLPISGVFQRVDSIPVNDELTFRLYVHESQARALTSDIQQWRILARANPCELLPSAEDGGHRDLVDAKGPLLLEQASPLLTQLLLKARQGTVAIGAVRIPEDDRFRRNEESCSYTSFPSCVFADYSTVAALCVAADGEIRASPLAISMRSLTLASDWPQTVEPVQNGPRPTTLNLRVYNVSRPGCSPDEGSLWFNHFSEFRVLTPSTTSAEPDVPLVPKLDVAFLPVVIAPGGNVNLYVREESTMVPYVPPSNELASRRTDHKKETFQRTLLFQSKQGRQNQDIPHFVFEFWR